MNANAAFEGSLALPPASERDHWWLIVLRAFIDDSGTGDAPVFVLAGFIASVNRWDEFWSAWKDRVLGGDPPIAYFKMREAHSRGSNGQFGRMSAAQRDARVTTCVSVIQQHGITPIRVVIPHAAYHDVFHRQVSKRLDNPYWLAFYGVMGNVVLGLDHIGNRDIVDFVFDEPGTRGGEASQEEYRVVVDGFDAFLKNAPPDMADRLAGRPSHKKDTAFPPLQAADLYAWHVRRFYYEREQGREYRDPVWWALSGIQGGLDVEFDKERLASMLQGMRARNAEAGMVFPYDLPPKYRKKALKQRRKGR